MLRGDINWANLEPVRGHEQGSVRPVLVISHDLFNERSGTVIALAITSQPQRAGYPLTWKLPPGTLPRDAWVKISQVRTLSTERLTNRAGRLSTADLGDILNALRMLVD
ncbi:MAG: type II toxin-antitoxin system PemK/MazF family toxin [Dehalococcoidia bacterium]